MQSELGRSRHRWGCQVLQPSTRFSNIGTSSKYTNALNTKLFPSRRGLQAPSVFFSTLPLRHYCHRAFAIHSTFLLSHYLLYPPAQSQTDPFVSFVEQSSPSLRVPYQSVRSHNSPPSSLIHDWLFTWLIRSPFSSQNSPQSLFPTASSLSHGLIPWNIDVQCLEDFGVGSSLLASVAD